MCLKDFMMRILVVDDLIRLVMVRSAGADDFTMWILAVPVGYKKSVCLFADKGEPETVLGCWSNIVAVPYAVAP